MSTVVDPVPAPGAVPFLDIVNPDFDFGSPEVARAQAESWYAETPLGILVLRYAEAEELMRDQRLINDGKRLVEMAGIFSGPVYDWFVPMISNRYGDDHRRLRSLVNRAFTARAAANLRPFFRATAERLAGRLASLEVCEFVEGFANPMPLAVMCEMLGVPPEDYDPFRIWSTDIGLVFSLAHGGDIAARLENAVVGLTRYVDSLMTAKQAAPGTDLVSTLVTARQAEGRVSWDELRDLLVTLVFAAQDTTRQQFANAMVAFAEHPDQWTLLAQHPELAAQAVEEVMRWRPMANAIFRFATEDFDYHGLHIASGTAVSVGVYPPHRDPRAVPGGDSFDITATREITPLVFGGGMHHCLGAALARAEMGEALPVLASRLGPPTIAGPVTWRPPTGIYGPNELPLRFG
jgi:cytochrome P450